VSHLSIVGQALVAILDSPCIEHPSSKRPGVDSVPRADRCVGRCDRRAQRSGPLETCRLSSGGCNQAFPRGLKAHWTMDADMSGDDVKVVRHSIIFTKRDFETALQAEQTEIVAYSTNGASFGGIKMAQFFSHLSRDGIPWPRAWKDRPSDAYPEVGQRIKEIRPEYQRYVDFLYDVISRQPKPEPMYDKQQTDAFRRIRDALE